MISNDRDEIITPADDKKKKRACSSAASEPIVLLEDKCPPVAANKVPLGIKNDSEETKIYVFAVGLFFFFQIPAPG